ncbi:MAG: peptidase M22 [Clostridiales bacterium]|nr:peptidase M22 [Clostridiales bacterium]
MSVFLGIDTSNYTTSAALYDTDDNRIVMEKQLLPVKSGELGLKQSDAVFQHVKQLPQLLDRLFERYPTSVAGIGVSVTPRRIEGSYMPCFLVGNAVASSLASVLSVPKYEFSHQEGHIMAALYAAGHLELLQDEFYAFHLSGGTTECLSVKYQQSRFEVRLLASSLDLKAGQAVDRVGVMLGLPFPAGKYLDEMACRCTDPVSVHPCMKGLNCSLSGVENQCRRMLEQGAPKERIARYCIEYIHETVACMTAGIFAEYGVKPVIYAGGVMSNSIIQKKIGARFGGYFASPEFSSDNSAGIAVLASMIR